MIEAVRPRLDAGDRIGGRDPWPWCEVPRRLAELLKEVRISRGAVDNNSDRIFFPPDIRRRRRACESGGGIRRTQRTDRPVVEKPLGIGSSICENTRKRRQPRTADVELGFLLPSFVAGLTGGTKFCRASGDA